MQFSLIKLDNLLKFLTVFVQKSPFNHEPQSYNFSIFSDKSRAFILRSANGSLWNPWARQIDIRLEYDEGSEGQQKSIFGRWYQVDSNPWQWLDDSNESVQKTRWWIPIDAL